MLKIATLNLRHNVDRWQERYPLLVETLVAAAADVIGMQEVWLEIEQAQMIADALNQNAPDSPYDVYAVGKWGPQPVEGIALLSRIPIVDNDMLKLPGEGYRVAQRIVIEHEGRRVNIANTHLHHRPIDDEAIRLPQMTALIDWMRDHDPSGWILTGDMNALPESPTIQAALAKFNSAYETHHGQHPVTFPTPLVTDSYPDVCIDHIFYDAATYNLTGANLIANQSHVGDATLYPSDHYGLAATFTWD